MPVPGLVSSPRSRHSSNPGRGCRHRRPVGRLQPMLPLPQQPRRCQQLLRLLLLLLLLGTGLLQGPAPLAAGVDHRIDDQDQSMGCSRERLRDLDHQAWQLVACSAGPPGEAVILRLVSRPGWLRFDHPSPLLLDSGRFHWELEDTTLANPVLVKDGRDAAAEFVLTPLLADLRQNRPLRLSLPGVIDELPIPPFVVREWRSLETMPADPR